MSSIKKVPFRRKRNIIAEDLRTSKYRKRVVTSKKVYNRKKEKEKLCLTLQQKNETNLLKKN